MWIKPDCTKISSIRITSRSSKGDLIRSCVNCAIRDRLTCGQGRKILSGFRASIKSGAIHSLPPTSCRFFGYGSLADTCEIRICARTPVHQKTRDSWFGFSHLCPFHGSSAIFITDEIRDSCARHPQTTLSTSEGMVQRPSIEIPDVIMARGIMDGTSWRGATMM